MMIFKRFLITASLLLLLGGCGESVFDKCVKGEKKKAVAKFHIDHLVVMGKASTGKPDEKMMEAKAVRACNAHGLYK
jgi:hypothetical protein